MHKPDLAEQRPTPGEQRMPYRDIRIGTPAMLLAMYAVADTMNQGRREPVVHVTLLEDPGEVATLAAEYRTQEQNDQFGWPYHRVDSLGSNDPTMLLAEAQSTGRVVMHVCAQNRGEIDFWLVPHAEAQLPPEPGIR